MSLEEALQRTRSCIIFFYTRLLSLDNIGIKASKLLVVELLYYLTKQDLRSLQIFNIYK